MAGDLRWKRVERSGGVIGSENFFGLKRFSDSRSDSPELKKEDFNFKSKLLLFLSNIRILGLKCILDSRLDSPELKKDIYCFSYSRSDSSYKCEKINSSVKSHSILPGVFFILVHNKIPKWPPWVCELMM